MTKVCGVVLNLRMQKNSMTNVDRSSAVNERHTKAIRMIIDLFNLTIALKCIG